MGMELELVNWPRSAVEVRHIADRKDACRLRILRGREIWDERPREIQMLVANVVCRVLDKQALSDLCPESAAFRA